MIVCLHFTGKERRQGEGGQKGVRGHGGRRRRRQGKVQTEGAQVPAVEVQVAGRSQGKSKEKKASRQMRERLSCVAPDLGPARRCLFVNNAYRFSITAKGRKRAEMAKEKRNTTGMKENAAKISIFSTHTMSYILCMCSVYLSCPCPIQSRRELISCRSLWERQPSKFYRCMTRGKAKACERGGMFSALYLCVQIKNGIRH